VHPSRYGNHPLAFLLLLFSGFVNRHQQRAIDDLLEENRILRGKLGRRRLLFTDGERASLARRARRMSWPDLCKYVTIVTPDTILRRERLSGLLRYYYRGTV
jgi:hypothetical protein